MSTRTLNGARKNAAEAESAVNEILANVSSEQHVRVRVNDLVAYEYIDPESKSWKWGLGTVAGLPGPRLVQLMLWSNETERTPAAPPLENPISHADRAAAAKELKNLEKAKKEVLEQVEELNKTLTSRQVRYSAGKEGYQQDLAEAEQTLRTLQKEVKSLPESDWREMRSYVQPPPVVALVFDAVMLTLGERTHSWNDILRVIRAKTFVKEITEFDPSKIAPANRRKLRKYLSNPRFTYEDAMIASRALGALQRWVSVQLEAASIKSGLTDYDAQRKRDKAELDKLTSQMSDFQRQVADLDERECALRGRLGDEPVDVTPGASPPGALKGDNAANARDSSPPHSAGRKTAPPVSRPEALVGGRRRTQSVYGTSATWVFTDETITILKSSVLVDYDAPKSTTITLTPEQVQQLKQALAARAAPDEQEAHAEAQRRQMQDELDTLIGKLADAQRELEALKQDNNEKERELSKKVRELEDLTKPGDASTGDDDAPTTDPAAAAAIAPPEVMAAKDDEIANLKARVAEAETAAEDAIQAMDEVQDAADRAQDEMRAAHDALADALQALDSAKVEAAEARQALAESAIPGRTDATGSAEELAGKEKEIDDLRRELEDAKRARGDERPVPANGGLASTNAPVSHISADQLADKEREIADLRDRIRGAERSVDDARAAMQGSPEDAVPVDSPRGGGQLPKGKGKGKGKGAIKGLAPADKDKEIADMKERMKGVEKALDDAGRALRACDADRSGTKASHRTDYDSDGNISDSLRPSHPRGDPMQSYHNDPNTPNAMPRSGSQCREKDRRDLRQCIDKLEEEIRVLRTQSASAHDALGDINAAFEANDKLKNFFQEIFLEDREARSE